ncbi:MAG: 3-dehydroquinate synthase [Oligoflexia bacterium]|nr:3-dehydroquinate synthase [Oligoflexia bacterium]
MNCETVRVQSGLLAELGSLVDFSRFSRVALIHDDKLADVAARICENIAPKPATLILQGGESIKTVAGAERCWKFFLGAELDRESLVLVLGGGSVCDLAGFAADTYQRGVAVVYIPSTLLAQADAAIGGKTALNFGGIKNCLGTFRQPLLVLCDTDLLSTLSPREQRSGFSEIVKIAIMRDVALFQEIESASDVMSAVHAGALRRAVQLKLDIVACDEREAGVRRFLNYGHTFGHALEALAIENNTDLLHGEAVAWGMLAEAYLAQQLGLLGPAEFSRISAVIKRFELLPNREPIWSFGQVLQKISHDKKRRGSLLDWAIPQAIGRGVVRSDVSPEVVEMAYQSTKADRIHHAQSV